jgi:DNA polymerase-1
VAIPHSGYQKAEYLGPAEILAKYGITPAQVTSYKGLTGDNSDNLAGVHGIGPKTAAALIQKYDSLKGIYEHLAEIAPTTRMKLERDQEQAFFCQRLATLLFDIHLPISLHDLSVKEFPTAAILAFFQECEFTVLAKRLQNLIVSDAYFKTHFAQVGSVVSGSKAGTSQLSLFV